VLYLTEPIDEVAVTNMGKYGDFDLLDVSKEDLELEETEEEKKAMEALSKELEPTLGWMKGDCNCMSACSMSISTH
jgi:HSP90 family molecular chaperone